MKLKWSVFLSLLLLLPMISAAYASTLVITVNTDKPYYLIWQTAHISGQLYIDTPDNGISNWPITFQLFGPGRYILRGLTTNCSGWYSYDLELNKPDKDIGTWNATVSAQVGELSAVNSTMFEVYDCANLTVRVKGQNGKFHTNGDVYIDGEWSGLTGSTFTVAVGNHTVFVNDFWEYRLTGKRLGFEHWEDSSVNSTRTIEVTENMMITAEFKKKYCPGDVDGNGKVTIMDAVIYGLAYHSHRGDPTWDSRADLDGDDYVDYYWDGFLIEWYFGSEYPDP